MNPQKGLHFTDVGTGEVALVFLHYFGGSSNSWSKVISELSYNFRCIAIDLPGFGNSLEIPKLSIKECVSEVARVIKSLSLKRYVLVGHSMGGKIALSLASIQPFGLEALVLIAPSPPTPEPMSGNERTQLLHAYGDPEALETLVKNITAQPLNEPDLEDVIRDNLRASYASWKWWVKLGSRENILPQTSTVEVPVFVVSGAMDPKFSSSFLRNEIIKYLPAVTFKEIFNAGHLLPIEAPAVLAKAIEDFAAKYL